MITDKRRPYEKCLLWETVYTKDAKETKGSLKPDVARIVAEAQIDVSLDGKAGWISPLCSFCDLGVGNSVPNDLRSFA